MTCGLPWIEVGAQARGSMRSRSPMVPHLSRQSRESLHYCRFRHCGKGRHCRTAARPL